MIVATPDLLIAAVHFVNSARRNAIAKEIRGRDDDRPNAMEAERIGGLGAGRSASEEKSHRRAPAGCGLRNTLCAWPVFATRWTSRRILHFVSSRTPLSPNLPDPSGATARGKNGILLRIKKRSLPLRDRHRILPWSGPSTESAIEAKLRGHKSSYEIPSGCAARHMRGGDSLMQRLRHAARRAAKHKTCRVEGRQALPHGTYPTTARQGQTHSFRYRVPYPRSMLPSFPPY